MKSRLTIALALVLALTATTTAAWATEGPSGSGTAADAQYAPVTPTTPQQLVPPPAPPETPPPAPPETPPVTPAAVPQQQVLPAVETPPVRRVVSEVAPKARPVSKAAPVAPVQELPAQPTTSAATLPFTGYDVLPVAIGGLALLGLGLVLRRQTRAKQR